ncbi:MAG TPA: SRPBCC family protein [Solirubrobacteraceae bacterium]|nr:SRPBCC family protein [Solirubrobacteraceae bacterium]
MVTRRSRVIAAPVEDVWRLVADPYAMPRWWPNAARVEGVRGDGWTTVLANARSGRSVRTDWRLDTSRKPSRRRWSQELDGTAFARLFARNSVEVELEPADAGTRLTLAFHQELRGWARLAPFVIRRGMRRQLRAALEGAARALEPGA